MYRLTKNAITGEYTYVLRLSDNALIPFSETNTDYQIYLKWLAEGNEPLPPDQGQ